MKKSSVWVISIIFILCQIQHPHQIRFCASQSFLSQSSLFFDQQIDQSELDQTLQTFCDWFTERSLPSLFGIKADAIFIFGNDKLSVFKNAAHFYLEDVSKKIIVSGGVGRLTISLLNIDEIWQTLKETMPEIDLVELKKVMARFKNADAKADKTTWRDEVKRALGPFKINEAVLIKGLLISYGVSAKDIVIETTSSDTIQNVSKAYSLIAEKTDLLPSLKSIILMQNPIAQRRAHYTFLKNWPDADSLKIYSYAAERFDISELSFNEKVKLAIVVRDEFLRLIARGQKSATGYAGSSEQLFLDQPIPEDLIKKYISLVSFIRSHPIARNKFISVHQFLLNRHHGQRNGTPLASSI